MAIRHGHTKTYVWRIWASMLSRCDNERATGFKWYGGKGVRVADRWRSFEAFLADMGHPPDEGHTLDRIDNAGHYEPGNCRWATRKEQMRNQTRNRMVTFEGRTQCVMDWAIERGLSHHCLLRRLYKYGWPVEKAILTPSERARGSHASQ